MTRAMAAQHGPENIQVNCVCPGMVFTPMVRGRERQDRINQNLLKQEGTGWDAGYGMKVPHQVVHKVHLINEQLFSFFVARRRSESLDLIMPVDGGTTAGKADRPASTADTLAEQNTKIPNNAQAI
ncbi:hypothetical protein N7481_007318, partial [Penicillium waksmanii]|uniref:uncharacterized protein n=1 Tax=Penicillium waksmanii TaxID=69791 RepID=UPI0025483D8D